MRLENFSSFGFAKGRLVCRAKPNVLKCAAGKKKLKMRVGKNFKNIRVGLSVGKVGLCQVAMNCLPCQSPLTFLVAKSPDF